MKILKRTALYALLSAATLFVFGCDRQRDEKQPVELQETSMLTVRVAQPEVQEWPESINVNGAIRPWQEIVVSPETDGLRVEQLAVEVGDEVKRGGLLVKFADDIPRAELRKNQALVAQSRANLELARANYRRAQETAHSGSVSSQQVEEYRITQATAEASLGSALADLDSSKVRLSQTRILATDDARIASKSGTLGEVAASGSELYRMIRDDKLEWRAEVDARQLGSIEEGQEAHVQLPDGRTIDGEVRKVGSIIDADTGRAIVYVSIPEKASARSGMFAAGRIELGVRPALTLPQSAVSLRDGKAYVWLVGDAQRVASRLVSTGRRMDDRVEVTAGLFAGERVVSAGGAFLAEGAKVDISTVGEPTPGMLP
ncbi:efflux RND transporter periplasmic adaptor subunit [Pseudomonas amygdali]|uniref:efflux RND transporter periplasmic adaptor subunit n=1 Tax=Pseudomonas amygdali TaxID=47877 RepID=UPI001C5A20AF|nr:efflux RND transporter periplasmic adaptor subunit [Pseudomonas amygdali]QXW42883.1 efflux RND transporter periplasmic adaptor subunit [Pseudomonas amygdali]